MKKFIAFALVVNGATILKAIQREMYIAVVILAILSFIQIVSLTYKKDETKNIRKLRKNPTIGKAYSK